MKKVIPPVVNMTAPTKNEKTLKNRTGERMWPLSEMSLPAATFWADVSNIVIAVSLAVGLVATLASMNLSNVKERHWDNAREKSQERIAELSADAEGSRAAIAGANERAAIAAQSAAEANERAAELQAENLALQAALAPRNAGILAVSGPAKANEWFVGLEAFSDTQVLIQAVSDDREANNLAFGIGLALSARGWKSSLITEKRSNLAPGHIREGVSVLYPVKNPRSVDEPDQSWLAWKNAADALAAALTKAHLGVGDLPVSSTGFVENPRMNPLGPRFDPPLDGVYLQVGPRPIGLTLQWLAQRRAQKGAQPR